MFKNKVTFRPHSTDSQTHRKMTLSIADRFSKAQKIRVLPAVGKDPESQRSERIKVRREVRHADSDGVCLGRWWGVEVKGRGM